MTLLRALAVGLLVGAVGALFPDPRGAGADHVRLALLTGLLVGQFLTVPPALLTGAVRACTRKGGASRAYDVPLGALLLGAGVAVVPPARAVLAWLAAEPAPGGVGDPDGETSIALLAGVSGCAMALTGLALLVSGLRARRRLGTPAGSRPGP
ncbi:hypothetical protein [Streptomyces sp. NPDC003090]|uniref:hypothetical protein n=1 Tax=Streptomyces sp. NPDC003090 TaxID=3154274 RepID=UPI00383088AC